MEDEKYGNAVALAYDKVNSRISVTVLFPEPICLKTSISFKGRKIPNGEFDVIVLSSSDTTLVHKSIAKRKHNICYEARLLSAVCQPKLTKPRKVLCYVGPKQVSCLCRFPVGHFFSCIASISDYHQREDFEIHSETHCDLPPVSIDQSKCMRRFPHQHAPNKFSISHSQFVFLPPSSVNAYGPVFIIDDGSQPKIELASKDRNIIAATFTHFLLKNIGGSETFKDKQDFFYHEVNHPFDQCCNSHSHHHLFTFPLFPLWQVRKYHANIYHEKLSLKVNREKILESSMKATKGFSVADWCGNFEVAFQGEQGIDWGGLRREWFEMICCALFDPRSGLFCSFHDKRQALVHPNPHRPPTLKLKHFEFAGKVVAKCLYESALGGSYRQMVRARFSRSFLAQLIGLRVHYKYFEQDDPDLYLSKIKYISETDLDASENLELYFVEDIYDSAGQFVKTVELVPNGAKIRVTNETKNQVKHICIPLRTTV